MTEDTKLQAQAAAEAPADVAKAVAETAETVAKESAKAARRERATTARRAKRRQAAAAAPRHSPDCKDHQDQAHGQAAPQHSHRRPRCRAGRRKD